MTSLDQLVDDQLRDCVVASDYPFIQCSHSGDSLPSIICVHAIADASQLAVEHATSTKVGKVTCYRVHSVDATRGAPDGVRSLLARPLWGSALSGRFAMRERYPEPGATIDGMVPPK